MIQEIGNRVFDNHFAPDTVPGGDDYIFVFRKAERGPDNICLAESGGMLRPPRMKELAIPAEELIYLFAIDDERFYLHIGGQEPAVPAQFRDMSLRVLRKAEPKHMAFAAMTAAHLHTWYRSAKFCGCCGSPTVPDRRERMMRCPACGNIIFPRINPAVTVALRHEDKLLVSRYNGRQQTNLYALIAGFVEIGESAEECVAREVMEEVGLKAVNIRYYGSQPWGFAGNLQMGYVADVEGSAEIVLDGEELSEAFFISRDELEYNPDRPALTQEMIEAFRTGKL